MELQHIKGCMYSRAYGTACTCVALLPIDWRRITEGKAYAGDKYYNTALGAWLPVTVNQGTEVKDYYALIRREER